MKISRLRTAIATFALLFSGVFLFGQERQIAIESVSGSGGQKYAFLVGVSDYENPKNFPALTYTVKDVEAWQKQLEEIGFLSRNIVVKASYKSVANRPSKEKILSSLSDLLSKVGSDDMIICMFSGHGVQIGQEQYFCPEDARVDNLSGSCVPLDEVFSLLKNSRAKFKWLIVDACRNELKKSTDFGVKSLGKVANVPKGITAIFSCADGETSYEDPSLELGVFTHFLLKGLSGEAQGKNGVITILDLYQYVHDQTQGFVRTKHSQSQVPYWSGDFTNFTIRDDLLRDGVPILKWNEAEASYLVAVGCRRNKDYAKALSEIKKSLSILPKKREYLDEQSFIEHSLERENRDLADKHAHTASTLLDSKDYVKAKTEIEKALQLFPNDVGYKSVKSLIEIAAKPADPPKPAEAMPSVSTPFPAVPSSSSTPPPPTGSWVGSKAGERNVLTIKGIEYAFRWCPSGKFTMGSPKDELGRFDDETQHEVMLTKGFWMLETEVTQGMWESVMGSNPSYNKGARLPVANVSWGDCQEFMTKLNTLSVVSSSGLKFSLPSEAQWEYACRAGTNTSLNSGKNITSETGVCSNLADLGWYGKNSDSKTHSVGGKKANDWGLYDMHGNVWEWCSDWFGAAYGSVAVTDPVGATNGTYRVARSGSRYNYARSCRSAYRFINSPGSRSNDLGFRPCLIPLVPQF